MKKGLLQRLSRDGLQLDLEKISDYIKIFDASQNSLPKVEQYYLMIKLVEAWQVRRQEKVLTIPIEHIIEPHLPPAVTFGIISSDWPGLSNSCIGVIHEKGWNIEYAFGITIRYQNENLGLILASILPENQAKYLELKEQEARIIEDIKTAAVGNVTKVYLLAEEIKKLQIYSSVIEKIEALYEGPDLEKLIGVNGEAIKFFIARSRDYIENRTTTDIAWQIIMNYNFQKKVRRLRSQLHFDIRNFQTQKEGEFTGITVVGMTSQFTLEDLLQSIEHACPLFQLKHHKDYTTDDGINVHRFEITNQAGKALNPSQIELLNEIFKNLEISKRRMRQNWLESIGGFEHYARAIIPFLIKQNKQTGKNQIYISVLQSTERLIDFKILIVLMPQKVKTNKLMYRCVNKLDLFPGFYISKVKPPSRFGDSEVIILDLKVDLTVNPEIETVYQKVRKIIEESFGKSRDFDEGMRQMDLRNFQDVKNYMPQIKESTLREYYYSLEDFYRVTAPVEEIAIQIYLCLEIQAMPAENQHAQILWQNVTKEGPNGTTVSPASIIVISYPHGKELLEEILVMFEDYEVILSKLERNDRDILICRLSKNRQALPAAELQALVNKLNTLGTKNQKSTKR